MKQIGFWLKKINQISQKETKHPTEFRFLLKARILVWVSGILNLLGSGWSHWKRQSERNLVCASARRAAPGPGPHRSDLRSPAGRLRGALAPFPAVCALTAVHHFLPLDYSGAD